MNKPSRLVCILSIAIATLGALLLGFKTFIGVFLLIWANNISFYREAD